jgi:ankyrin repeat protein
LRAAGVELDRQNKNGQTALILAIGNGAVESAKQLILSGARTDIKDGLGMTATKYAELFHHTEILRLLESRSGSDRDAGDRGSAEA